ncbi:LCP family protein [Candidatus Saccharibacteria bacterium]|nr:LCP family protein [Candidatus Saccharibacteria bacterium]
MNKENGKKKTGKIVWLVIKSALVILQLVVSALLVVSLVNMGIIDNWIITVIGLVLLAILILNVVILLVRQKSKMWAQVICIILGIICIAGSIFALNYTDAFNGFLDKITGKKPELKTYNVLVINDEINDIQELDNKSFSLLSNDKDAKRAEEYLNELISFNVTYYDDLGIMLDVLKNGLTDAIVLESGRTDVLIGEDNEESIAVDGLKIVYTFEIEIEKKEAETSNKNITLEPFIIYISGSDSRTGIKGLGLSDVNIVVVVNQRSGKILLASIPRDTYVQLHGTEGLKDKLTHAGIYGIDMSKTTIEDFLGIKIDYTVKVSFDTVIKVVDTLGGIDIYSDTKMNLNKNCHYIEGWQHVDGTCALRFARERKSYYLGDKHRGYNQQEVLTAIINKMTSSKEYLLKAPEILNVASETFETSLSRDDIIGFIRMQLANPIKWEIESVSVDGEGTKEPTYSMGASLPLYVMIADEDSVNSVVNKINEYLTVSE